MAMVAPVMGENVASETVAPVAAVNVGWVMDAPVADRHDKTQTLSPDWKPKLLENVFIYSKDGRTLFLNPEIPDWISIKNKYEGIFKRFDGSCSLAELDEYIGRTHVSESGLLQQQIRNIFKSTRIFTHNGAPEKKGAQRNEFVPRYVYLTLTDSCNLKCAYCYAKERSQSKTCSFEDWISFVDQFHEMAKPLYFNFTGGEPLLVPFVLDLAKYIKKSGSNTILLTNGMKIDSMEMAEKISRCFDEVKISLDSIDEAVSAELRGKEVLGKVERARELLMACEVKVTIVATVTEKNCDRLREFCDYFDQMVSFQPLYRMGSARGCGNLTISGDRYYQTLSEAGILKMLPGYSSGIGSYEGNPYKRCAFGIEELSIAPDGALYPCHMLHYSDLCIGNLRTYDLKSLYHHSEILKRLRHIDVDSLEQCKNCEVRNFCGGGCRGRVDFRKDGIHGKDEFCTFEKKSILDALLVSYS